MAATTAPDLHHVLGHYLPNCMHDTLIPQIVHGFRMILLVNKSLWEIFSCGLHGHGS